MEAYYHATSSSKAFGGVPEDYLCIHAFLDSSRNHISDPRHRMLYHHSGGIAIAMEIFGHTITNSQGRKVPVRHIAQQHITEDLGFIPSVQDWADCLRRPRWGSPKTKLLFSSFTPEDGVEEAKLRSEIKL